MHALPRRHGEGASGSWSSRTGTASARRSCRRPWWTRPYAGWAGGAQPDRLRAEVFSRGDRVSGGSCRLTLHLSPSTPLTRKQPDARLRGRAVEFTLNGNAVAAAPGETIIQTAAAARHRDPAPLLQGRHAPRRQLPRVHGRDQGRARARAFLLPRPDARDGGDDRQRARRRIRRRWCSSCCSRTCRRSAIHAPFRARPLGRAAGRRQAALRRASQAGRRSLASAIAVNLDACIQCTRCVRACREEQVNDVIGYAFRGEHSKIVFDLDDPMGGSTCVACGECVQACPTGALMPARDVGLISADKQVDSVCPYCGVGCQLTYNIKDNRILLRRRPRRPGEPRPPVREGPLRLRLRAAPAAPDEAADPQARRAEARRFTIDPDELARRVPRSDAGRRRSSSRRAGCATIRDSAVRQGARRLRLGQGHQRRGVSLPEARAHRLRHEQRRSLHAAVPCLERRPR